MFAARQGFFYSGSQNNVIVVGLIGNSSFPLDGLASVSYGDFTYQVILANVSGGNVATVIAKFDNSTNTIVWQKQFLQTSFVNSVAIAVDSSGNLYVGGYIVQNPTISSRYPLIFAVDPNGSLIWQKILNNTTLTSTIRDIAVSSNNNTLIVVGSGSSGSTDRGFYAGYDLTNGNLKYIKTTTATSVINRVLITSNGNTCYMLSSEILSASPNPTYVVSYSMTSSSLTQSISAGASVSGGDVTPYAISFGPSELLRLGVGTGTGGTVLSFIQYGPALAIISQQTFSQGGTAYSIRDMAYDTTGNTYVLIKTPTSSTTPNQIVKLDNNGNYLWTRFLKGTSLFANKINWYNNKILISGSINNSSYLFSAPDDGTGIGVYGPFTYGSTGSSISATSIFSNSGGTVDVTNTSMTSAGGSMTSSSSSYALYSY